MKPSENMICFSPPVSLSLRRLSSFKELVDCTLIDEQKSNVQKPQLCPIRITEREFSRSTANYDSEPATPEPALIRHQSSSNESDDRLGAKIYEKDCFPCTSEDYTASTWEDSARYVVERLADVDDLDLRPDSIKFFHRLMPFVTISSIVASLTYFGYRIHCTLSTQHSMGKVFPMAWVFIIAETFATFPQLFYTIYSFLALRSRNRPKLRLRGDNVPMIDVFVTCCKEDVDVILDTTRAACAVDYPEQNFRVVVCDDGADPVLKEAVESLSNLYPNLIYWSRPKVKGKPHHFKAGNLIAATEMVAHLPSGPAEYIAALDADMIPEPHWLRTLMAHMVIDKKMSLVCPPQSFYNLPEGDPLYQSLDSFALVQEVIKDANGVAWCTGSGYVVRRAALDSVGGWPTGSLAEDVFTSSMLIGHGWKTAFVNEPLQFGLVPDTFTAHLKQRTRWTLGTLQTAAKLNFCLFGPRVKGMGFRQRLSGFLFPVDNLFRLFISMAILAIPIGMISGKRLVLYVDDDELRWQIRLGFVAFAAGRFAELITNLPSGYRLARRDFDASLWMIPYNAITIIQSFVLPKWLGGKAMAFSPTGSLLSELNERDMALRAPLHRRLKVIILDCKAYIHLFYVVFTITAVMTATCRALQGSKSRAELLLYLVTHICWPPMIWVLSVAAFTAPLRYALWPPTMPDRESLLERDPQTFVAHPMPEFRQRRWSWQTWLHDALYTSVTVYSTLAFAATFVL